MNITQRKMLFFGLTGLISGIASIILRNEPYIDLIADTAEYLYIFFILRSVLRIFGSAPTIFHSIPPIFLVLALSPRRLKDLIPWLTGSYVSYSFFLIYACFSFMIVAPVAETIITRNKAKQKSDQNRAQEHCKHCNTLMFSTDIFCPKCSKLSTDVIDFLQKHPSLHHLNFSLDNRHGYLYCPFCDMYYSDATLSTAPGTLNTPIFRCSCGAFLMNHHSIEWAVVPTSRKIRYCIQGGPFAFVIFILFFSFILSLPDAEYAICAFFLLLYAAILRILWLRWITVFEIQDSYERLKANPHYPKILAHMAYEYLVDSYRHLP